MLATAYPRGTTFNVYAQAGSGCNYLNKNRYSCKETFTKVNSVSKVRSSTGNVYHFDSSSGLLYVRIVQMPDDFVGDKSWHRWDYDTPSAWETGAYALERFSRGGVTLPTGKPGKSYVMIEAICSGYKYCSQKPLSGSKPSVCSSGYQQVAYDKCCKGTGQARQCEFANGANANKLASTEEDGGESGGGGGGMGAGALMGIVVGAIAVVAGLVGAIAYRMWSRRQSPIDDVSVGHGSQGLKVSRVDACLSDVDTCLSATRPELSELPIKQSSDTMTQSGFLGTIDPDGMEFTRTHSLPHKFFECDSTLAMNAADVKPAPSA